MTHQDPLRDQEPRSERRWWLLVPAALLLAAVIGPRLAPRPTPPPPPAEAWSIATEPAAVVIRDFRGIPAVDTGLLDRDGNPVGANCSTCHATRTPNARRRHGEDLEQFHTGLHTNHGGLTCLSCHNRSDYGSLTLADGTAVAFPDRMQLCAQCHGPQHRDYVNGSHGGMQGYWDLSRGGRTRNACTVCHDPHAPQFPIVQPVFRPIDRFLGPPVAHHDPRAGLTTETPTGEVKHD